MISNQQQIMKKIILFSIAAAIFILVAACCDNQAQQTGACRIHGVVTNPNLEGKKIFLVPFFGPSTAANVDSVEIRQGKFEFATDTLMIAKILIDYHFRDGFQPLLVVVEPGDVNVVIDSISSGGGTPQNDSLQLWKQVTEVQQGRIYAFRKANNHAAADSVYRLYKHYTRSLAANMKEGLLHDFLKHRFPLTYKKQLPDGRVVTMNSDTNEEIK